MKYFLAASFLYLIIFTGEIYSQSGGKISGIVFMDYYYNLSRDSAFASLPNTSQFGNEDANGFDIRRAYLTYDYIISESFSTRFRLEADGRSLTDNKRITVFVKDAFIRWKEILPGQELIFGIQPPPAYEISEAFYGFRSLEKTQMDVRGAVSSRDFGLAARGLITGTLKYWLLFGNSSGVSPEADKYKRIYAHLSVSPLNNFTTTFYGDIRFREKIDDPLSSSGQLNNNILTTAFFAGYSDVKTFSIGTEIYLQMTENGYSDDASGQLVIEDKRGLGISTFGWLKLQEKLTATLRYDYFDPGLNEKLEYDKRHYIIAGLSYRPVDMVAIIPNVLIETYEETPDRQIDASVTPRITVTYEFQ